MESWILGKHVFFFVRAILRRNMNYFRIFLVTCYFDTQKYAAYLKIMVVF